MIREVRQRELKLLIQAPQPASGKAKIWAWAVGLLSLYLITAPYWPSQGERSVQRLPQRSTLPGEETQSTRVCSHMLQAPGEQKREGLFYKGKRERIRKAALRKWPLSTFQSSLLSLQIGEPGGREGIPCRQRHLCWGWQVWTSWGLRDTQKEGGQDTRY